MIKLPARARLENSITVIGFFDAQVSTYGILVANFMPKIRKK